MWFKKIILMKNIFIIISIFLIHKSYGQDTELFPGENKLSSCQTKISITSYYKTKDKNSYIQKLKEFKDIEIVLLTYNKKTKTAKYTNYYIVVDEKSDHTFVYLETPEDHKKLSGKKQAFFISDNPKTERFYVFDCFLKTISDNAELKEIIQQK